MRQVPHVGTVNVQDDEAHYYASIALDAVLAWFVDDGYGRQDLEDLAVEHSLDAFGDDE